MTTFSADRSGFATYGETNPKDEALAEAIEKGIVAGVINHLSHRGDYELYDFGKGLRLDANYALATLFHTLRVVLGISWNDALDRTPEDTWRFLKSCGFEYEVMNLLGVDDENPWGSSPTIEHADQVYFD